MNRAKLKFTNINTTTSRVSVRNKETSPRERAQNKLQENKECDTRICFTEVRFLQTYSPLRRPQRPGLFQPFPLSNGPSDRVSFSSQIKAGTKLPRKGHHTIGASCLDYNGVVISRTSEKEKKQSKRKSTNEHGKSLSLVTRALCGIGEDLISLVCLELNARALVVVEKWKTWMQ